MTADPNRAGDQILRTAAEAARTVLGDRLVAAFAIGSLAHGGFAPLVSDIDIAVILDRVDTSTPASIDVVRELSLTRCGPGLAERLSIFWSDWPGVRDGPGPDCRLPAIDRLDLLDNGSLLLGTDERAGSSRPGRADLVREGAEFACARFDDAYLTRLCRPEALVRDGARAVTKAVLFPIRFLYTLATGRIGQNDAAAAWYVEHGAHPPLARAAMEWRVDGVDDTATVVGILDEHLAGVHLEFAEGYAQAMRSAGHDGIAADLEDRQRSLVAHARR